MKRLILALLILLMFTLAGCKAEQSPEQSPGQSSERSLGSTWDRVTEYSSDTSAEDCYLCGGGVENLVPSYWGQENVAFISLNTFEIVPLEINRYDKMDGHLIEEPADIVSFGGGSSTDGGFSATLMLNYDRGFADGALDFNNDEILDTDKAASFLCADCLNGIIEVTHGPYFGVAVIDLETKAIRVLEKRLGGFGLGDYYIFCEIQEQKENKPLQMELLIINAPRRYRDK